MLPLIFADENKEYTVGMISGNNTLQRLQSMGIRVGAKIEIISKNIAGVIIKIGNARYSLDRLIAKRISVK